MNTKVKNILKILLITIMIIIIVYAILLASAIAFIKLVLVEKDYTVDLTTTQMSENDYNRVLDVLGDHNADIIKISCSDITREGAGIYYIFFNTLSDPKDLVKNNPDLSIYQSKGNSEISKYLICFNAHANEKFKIMQEICKKYYDKRKKNGIYLEYENWELM